MVWCGDDAAATATASTNRPNILQSFREKIWSSSPNIYIKINRQKQIRNKNARRHTNAFRYTRVI